MSADIKAMSEAKKDNVVTISKSPDRRKSEYSQAYGNPLPKEKRNIETKLTWKKRNHSTIFLPSSSLNSPSKENIRPEKSKQSWPWRERAQSSQIFGPFKDLPVKAYKQKWPWDNRPSKSYILSEESNKGSGDFVKSICKDTIERTISLIDTIRPAKGKKTWPWRNKSSSTCYLFGSGPEKSNTSKDINSENAKPKVKKELWPWQKRAMTSEIFCSAEDKDISLKTTKKREYTWNQGKSTHDHKVDSKAKLDGISQYKKDFCVPVSTNANDYDGPRHGYRYLLSRRESAASIIPLPKKTPVEETPKKNEDELKTLSDVLC